ncbi:hypothetical protein [Azomonas macrocytogenes]|uniref:Uncharacterized protein n=1 Tax=Azomonas macrocytogenes TaxID=69962 RepID=A0A839SZH3_AZOMA|nr:hypothetical protein [Azomonas macrocytogenes]MBB3102288.1 hypothetical protein [Azomonas macrocytogenes]
MIEAGSATQIKPESAFRACSKSRELRPDKAKMAEEADRAGDPGHFQRGMANAQQTLNRILFLTSNPLPISAASTANNDIRQESMLYHYACAKKRRPKSPNCLACPLSVTEANRASFQVLCSIREIYPQQKNYRSRTEITKQAIINPAKVRLMAMV